MWPLPERHCVTLAADDVHLRRDVVADGQRAFVIARRAGAELLDEAAELVAVDARRRAPSPRIDGSQ